MLNNLKKYLTLNITRYDLPWLALFFVIPVFPILISPSILLIVFSLFVNNKKLKTNFTFNRLLLLPFFLYVAYMFGLFFTDTNGMPIVVAERKLSFLVFPLIFIFHFGFDELKRKLLWYSFFTGLLLYSFISFCGSAISFYENQNFDSFFSSAFSFELHPSYSSFYFCIAIVFLLNEMILHWRDFSKYKKMAFLSMFFLFSFVVFLLASKLGLISYLLILISALIYFTYKSKKFKILLFFTAIIGLIMLLLFFVNPVPLQRFKNIFSATSISQQELFMKHHNSIESNTVRRMIWIVSTEIIKENPWGVGSGDANEALMVKYKEKDMNGAFEKQFNAHNQYLQTTIALGFIGLSLLILLLLAPIFEAFRKRSFILFMFSLVVILNLSVESMFESESGIVFICLFYCFLLGEKKKNHEF
jgi:O-antigen ligase